MPAKTQCASCVRTSKRCGRPKGQPFAWRIVRSDGVTVYRAVNRGCAPIARYVDHEFRKLKPRRDYRIVVEEDPING